MARQKLPRRRQEGFSMATVMLIVLAVILGSVAMIDRATSGFLGSLFVGQSREARDAAEIGLARVVSQLNRSRNRRLLVNGELLNSRTLQQIEADSNLKSRCSTLTPDLSGAANSNPRGEFGIGSLLGTQRDIDTAARPASGTIRSYEVVSISQPSGSREFNSDYSANNDFAIRIGRGTTPAQGGEVMITVRGLVRRGDTLVASTTIAGTFNVVPKCCNRSFNGAGNAFGNDTRACNVSSLGVITGTSQQAPASGLIASGASVSFNAEDAASDPLPYVVCITTGCNAASSLNTNTGTVVKEEDTFEINFADIRKKYTGIPTIDEPTEIAAANINLNTLATGPLWDGSTLALDTSNFSSWPSEFQSACREVNENDGTPAIHCSIGKLDFGANNRTIEFTTSTSTSRKPLRLYFPNVQANQAEKTINQRNNGSFSHSSAQSGANGITDLMLIGNNIKGEGLCPEEQASERQIVDLGNGTNQALRIFAYFRCGTVNIGGNGGYTGILWANKVVANGNVTFVSPSDAVSQALNLTNWENPIVDWVARSMRSLDLF